ncbi:late competence development ComFB family protein [Tumidithrix elongata RA019]|uniref:Late competence development ComFB family protein n=1 Tax=Tumidithrix elongata BACA0141 TaxID=2716417 RepID=A0AAW9PQD1_9CYAN|nr:late competence development ComFB family protein [Tumidithrix elongata RA019]
MASLKNAIEDIVVFEAKEQLKRLGNVVREQIDLSEVVAYALNRLPPLYASTSRGWLQQRKRANIELKPQIVSAVQHAMLNVRRDPLRRSTPLSVDDLDSPAHALAKLQKLLGKSDMKWKDVPNIVQTTFDESKSSAEYGYMSISDRSRVKEIKGYLQRTKSSNDTRRSFQDAAVMLEDPMDMKEFESYMLMTNCVFTNVLENLVIQVAQDQTHRMSMVLARHVEIDDVAAYALNRLPTMYATTEQGVERQTQRARQEMSNQIASTVIQALMTLSKTPRRLVSPIPILKFEEEREQALTELRQLLQRDDITWRNLPRLIEEALEQSTMRSTNWRQRWRMLGQIYREMYLKPGDADIFLTQSEDGEVLLIQANTKESFWMLAEHSQALGRSTLRLFPSVAYIELSSYLLETPLTYTRDEMAADGIM